MRVSFDLRPTRLLVGVGALLLTFAVGAAAASSGAPARTAAGPAAPAVAAVDDTTDASAALGLGEDAALVAAIGVDGTADQPAAAKLKGGILRAIIGKTERAEITVSTAENGQKTILYVRGTFSAASATSVTVTLKDGTKQAFTLDATTTVRSAGKAKAIADIPTSGRGLAVGVKNADGTYTAKFVRFAPAK